MDITLDTHVMSIDDLAGTQKVVDLIYSEVHGDSDSKALRERKGQAIFDWLMNGDLTNDPTIGELAREWAEYDA